jgi:uncharacterized protein (DUF58 family)
MKWFLGAGILLALAYLLKSDMLAYAMYALLALLIVSRWLSHSWISNLHATRACNRLTAEIGDLVGIELKVSNSGSTPIPWVLLEDVLPPRAIQSRPPGLLLEGSHIQLAMVRGGDQKTIRYQLRCQRRGYFQLGPVIMETGDLFGLHRRYRVTTEPDFLLVYPKVIPLEGYDLTSRRPIGEVTMSYRLFEDPTRIRGVRPFQQGDPLNRIHWRATARTGEIYSKVYEPTTVAGATIVLEFHKESYDPAHEPVRSELAITAAASIANSIQQMGQQVGLCTNGRDAVDRIRQEGWDPQQKSRQAAREATSMLEQSDRLQPLIVETRRDPEQFLRIREALARVELTDGLTLAQLSNETSSRIPRDATVIVIIPAVNEETVLVLSSLKRRGFAVLALLNLYDENAFAEAAGALLADGINSLHLADEDSIRTICQHYSLR